MSQLLLRHIRIISFPDDDFEYPADLQEQVMRRFETDDEPDLFSGSCRSKTGGDFEMAKFAEGEAVLTLQNLWNRHIFSHCSSNGAQGLPGRQADTNG